MDDDFLSLAEIIRKDIVGNPVVESEKTSKYNSKLYVHKCLLCGERATDTHHIKFRATADKNDMIGVIHKNVKSNLVPICKSCYDSVHRDEIHIDGYIKTTEGIELQYKKYDIKRVTKRLKYEKDVPKVLEFRDIPKMTRKRARKLLKERYDIDISEGIISKKYGRVDTLR